MFNNLAWLDLEMTGLIPEEHVILQASLIITNNKFEELERLTLDIWQPEEKLQNMVPFVRQMHTDTGLLEKVKNSKTDVKAAESKFLKVLTKHCEYPALLCGNTIGRDRMFLDKYMPAFAGYLHYRMLDVSSFKVLIQILNPEKEFIKTGIVHTSEVDIENSILELEHYLNFLKV